ncbi:hypothetical protein ZWY2020_018471 [Hordeum vulgare]|nr:hypothetical protein ZWY2020_018471 [Hordeum vulgare]
MSRSGRPQCIRRAIVKPPPHREATCQTSPCRRPRPEQRPRPVAALPVLPNELQIPEPPGTHHLCQARRPTRAPHPTGSNRGRPRATSRDGVPSQGPTPAEHATTVEHLPAPSVDNPPQIRPNLDRNSLAHHLRIRSTAAAAHHRAQYDDMPPPASRASTSHGRRYAAGPHGSPVPLPENIVPRRAPEQRRGGGPATAAPAGGGEGGGSGEGADRSAARVSPPALAGASREGRGGKTVRCTQR